LFDRRLRLRWVLLLVMVAVLVSLAFIPELPRSLPALVVIGGLAFALLLYRLDSFSPIATPTWLAIFLFLALYFVRLPFLLDDPTRLDMTFAVRLANYFHSGKPDLGLAFTYSMLVFVPFCVAAFGMLSLSGVTKNMGGKLFGEFSETRVARDGFIYLICIIAIMLISSFVAYKYRIGQMGVDPGTPLPFRLKGIVFYGRAVILPLLILAVVYLGYETNKRWLLISALALLVAHGVSDMLLRGSRSSLMLVALLTVFLVASGGFRLRRGMLLLLGIVVAGAIWLMPVAMNYRILRMETDTGTFDLLLKAFSAGRSDVVAALMDGLTVIYYRIPGIETIWSIIGFNGEPLGQGVLQQMRTPFGITGYLNFDIYKIPMDIYMLYAPGFVGWLFLAGGQFGLILGGALLGIFCVVVPKLIYSFPLYCRPVANTFWMWLLFVCMTDATIDGNTLMLASGLVGLVLVEVMLRRALP
jgi:hypothetical protein